jgi:hypothetical protein
MAKIKLDLEPDPEVTVIGISSHVNDYRLCWSLNRSMGLALRRCQADILDGGPGRSTGYAVFEHAGHDPEGRYLLVSNHGTDGILIKEQRQADFFLVVDNALAERETDLLQRIRAAEFVLTAFDLPFAELRMGHKLLHEPT